MTERFPAGLQDVAASAAPSGEAVVLAMRILDGSSSIGDVIDRVARHFIEQPRVDTVAAALTTFAPDDAHNWKHLGQRAWVREWLRPGSSCQVVPSDDDAGPEAALTMPYMSQFLRDMVAVIPDSEGLPPEGERDRQEMAACGARALIASAQVESNAMYGSLSLGSSTPGDWPETYVADLRLLSSALTSRMAAEQARRLQAEAIAVAEQAKGQQQQFFSTIGHELRTPIAAIIGFAEMMADEARDRAVAGGPETEFAETVGRDSGVVLRAGEQLLAIVEDLLSTGRTLGDEDARTDQDLAAAVEDVMHWHRTPALANAVEVVSDVPSGLTVHARAAGLRQVLTNLVGNAIIHNRRGGDVFISAAESLGEGREPRVRISVRDTGRGLSADEVRRVFEPFVRFAGAEVKGTGLGLPLARAVAERDGGIVGAESTKGEGSVFWLDLPAKG